MSFKVVIPARYGSSRFPGKPLADINGQAMVIRVYERARKAGASEVIIATDDERVLAVAKEAGARCVMTRSDHESGTDRIQEVAKKMGWRSDAVVVNVQGDEPAIPAANIQQCARLLEQHSRADVATLYETIQDEQEFQNPNVVKLVQRQSGEVLYFSRAPIPYPRDGIAQLNAKRHLGIYAYRVSALDAFVTSPVAELESIEKLEQLRYMAMGKRIWAAEAAQSTPPGVDTPTDLEVIKAWLAAHE